MNNAIGAAHAALRVKVKRSTPKPFEVEVRKRRRALVDAYGVSETTRASDTTEATRA